MAKYKNISGGPLDLSVPGFEARVEDGDVVDIPAFQPDGESPIVVPENRWEPVADVKAKAAKASAAEAPAEAPAEGAAE